MVEAVIWDFGGVLTSSPFEAFNRYEAEKGLAKDFIRGINATNPDTNAWALFERNECSLDDFDRLFAAESEAKGCRIPGRDIISEERRRSAFLRARTRSSSARSC